MIDLAYLVKDLIKCKGDLRQFTKNRLAAFDDLTIVENKNISYIVSHNGIKYYPDKRINGAIIGGSEYKTNDIKSTDVVLDIGGFYGTFAIPISQKCKHVYVIEPIFTEEITANIELNEAANITLLPYAISNKCERIDIEYWGKKKTVQSMPLSKIIEMIDQSIDFLKIDIEGAEWWINPGDISKLNPRRIEFEMHQNITTNNPAHLYNYIKENYKCNETPWKLNDKRTGFLSAVKDQSVPDVM